MAVEGAGSIAEELKQYRVVPASSRKDDKRQVISGGTLQGVLTAIRKHPNDLDIQKEGIRLLRGLSEDFDNRVLLTNKIYEDILNAVKNHGRNPLASSMIQDAFAALTLLARNDAALKIIIGDPHYAHEIVALGMSAQLEDAGVQFEGSRALMALAIDKKEIPRLVNDIRAHETLLEAMRLHPTDAAVHIHCLGALWTFSWNASVHGVLKSAGAVEAAQAAKEAFPDEDKVELYADELLQALGA